MNENLEKYISELEPQLQEKARECKTKEELNTFLADNELELPDEALEMVAGGCGTAACDHSYELVERAIYNNYYNKYPGIYYYNRERCRNCGDQSYEYFFASSWPDVTANYRTKLTKAQFEARYDPISHMNIKNHPEYSLSFYMNHG